MDKQPIVPQHLPSKLRFEIEVNTNPELLKNTYNEYLNVIPKILKNKYK